MTPVATLWSLCDNVIKYHVKQVNLLGEKVVDPLIHSCEKCTLPILIYGRMVHPHYFAFSLQCFYCYSGVSFIFCLVLVMVETSAVVATAAVLVSNHPNSTGSRVRTIVPSYYHIGR